MLEPTEGIAWSKVHNPFLKRNLPSPEAERELGEAIATGTANLINKDDLLIRVIPENYKLHFSGSGFLYRNLPIHQPDAEQEVKGEESMEESRKEKRNSKFEEMFVRNTPWMKGKSGEEVDRIKTEWLKWVKEGPSNLMGTSVAADVEMDNA